MNLLWLIIVVVSFTFSTISAAGGGEDGGGGGKECEIDPQDDGVCRNADDDEKGTAGSSSSKSRTFPWLGRGFENNNKKNMSPLDFLKESLFGGEHEQSKQQADKNNKEEEEDYDPFGSIREGEHKVSEDLFESMWNLLKANTDDDIANDSFWQDIILKSIRTSSETVPTNHTIFTLFQEFGSTISEIKEQIHRAIGNVTDFEQSSIDLVQFWYYLLNEESNKNAVWKRKIHRYLPPLKIQEAMSLQDGLYLSQLSYVDSCATIETFLSSEFHNNTWALVNCTTAGFPSKPAHFVAVRRQSTREASAFPIPPWDQKKKDRILEVALVVRGSKELSDFLSDGLFEPVSYRGGLAHSGIRDSAIWLHDLYNGFFHSLRELSNSTKIKVWLVGHSLGAGTAALATMEFNARENNEQLEAHALGFGTPAVLSRELSESLQSTVTTVVNDADCVPRMSGASIINKWLQISRYNFTQDALDDLYQLLPVLKGSLPFGESLITDEVKSALADWLGRNTRSSLNESLVVHNGGVIQKVQQVLFPPGDCLHLYRDGLRWRGNYMGCHKFDELEVVRHTVDDHLIAEGYYLGLLGFIRGEKNACDWQFERNLMSIPV